MRIAIGLAMLLAVSGARAAEITMKVTDADQAAFGNLAGAVDACVAGLQLRGDAAMCKAIAAFASDFGGRVKAAVPAPEAKVEK